MSENILTYVTAQKMKFFIKNFSSKCDQIRMNLRVCSHLMKKSLVEYFIFCAVIIEPHKCFLKVDFCCKLKHHPDLFIS